MIARADCAKTIQEEMKMRESKFKNYDALPLTLTAPEVGEVLGISRAAAYELVRSKGFPHIRIGTRILVPKDKFISTRRRITRKSMRSDRCPASLCEPLCMALPGNVGKGTIRIGDEFGLISEDLRGTKRIAG